MATFVITATLSAAAIYLLRMFIKGKRFSEMVNAKDKVVIITGASSGIGKQLTRELNLRGAKVYMFCRDEDKTFQARLDLVRYGCDPTRMTYIHCDLSDIFSIKKAVDDFKKEEPVVDILINNAGIMYYPDFKLTNDNCELTWQTNYLGHFVLTELLIPYLEKSDDGRIINVSSGSEHRCKELNLEKINSSEYFGRMDSYSRSKLAQVMHAIELTKRLRANNPLTKITINSCEPGVVNTNICRYTFLDIKFFNCLLAPVRWFFLKTSNDGAQCPLFLALSKKLYGISGKHFKDCVEKSNINHLAMNEELCSELSLNGEKMIMVRTKTLFLYFLVFSTFFLIYIYNKDYTNGDLITDNDVKNIQIEVDKLRENAEKQIEKMREEIIMDKEKIDELKSIVNNIKDHVTNNSNVISNKNIIVNDISNLQEPPIILPSPEKTCSMKINNLFTFNNSDVQMLNAYEDIPFSNVDGGVWKQGWNIEYKKEEIFTEEPLKVFIIPHSHQDPGWLKTFEGYYSEQVDKILTSLTNFLTNNKDMKFIYAEMSFLERFWKSNNDEMREKFKKLVKEGNIEIVTGGWVMTDEANSHYYAQIMELFEGHEFLRNQLDGFIPTSHWSIDPFGLSPTMAYLVKKSNLTNMAIQRVHYEVKKYLAERQKLEFHWRQLWDNSKGETDIFTSMFPFFSYDVPHTCGPDPSICCQFDFIRILKYGCPWGANPRKIITHNLHERASTIADQYRKKSRLFKYNTVFIPLGDDFRYEDKEEISIQYDNYKLLLEYINSPQGRKEYNMDVKFGTLKDYFDSVHANMKKKGETPSVLSGDFFTYADHDDHYWSGYYTTRPFYKRMDRFVQHYLRAADLMYSSSLIKYKNNNLLYEDYKKAVDYSLLVEARRYMSLFQHHDGVTGTGKDFVVVDYAEKMLTAINNCFKILQDSISFNLMNEHKKNVKFTVDELIDGSDKIPKSHIISQDSSITIYNPLSKAIDEVVCVSVDSYEVRIKNLKESYQEMRPVVTTFERNFVFGREEKNIYELCFRINIEGLGIKIYDLIKEQLPITSFAKISSYGFNFNSMDPEGKYLKNDVFSIQKISESYTSVDLSFNYISIKINKESGFLEEVNHSPVSLSFSRYGVRSSDRSKPGGEVVSGAYLFLPDGPSKPLSNSENSYIILSGNLKKTVIVKGITDVDLLHKTEIIINKTYVTLENEINLTKVLDYELALKIKTNIDSGEEFFTDLNGYQIIRRKRFSKIPLQGNFYPMPGVLFIQDKNRIGKRVSLIGNQALGCSSTSTGEMEVILDRRLTHDDSRGLASGILDNVRTKSNFRLVVEDMNEKEINLKSPNEFLTKESQLIYQSIHYKPVVLFTREILNINNNLNISPLKKSLPCDYHVVGMRTESEKSDYSNKAIDDKIKYEPKNSVGLIIQRYAFNCNSLPTTYFKDSCKESDDKGIILKESFNIDSYKVFNTSLTMNYVGREEIDSILLTPMEVNTYKIEL